MIKTLLNFFLCGLLLAAVPAFAQGTPVELKNPAFEMGEGGSAPDGWEGFPGGNGGGTLIGKAADGGVRLFDEDGGKGVGLIQWVPVKAGKTYQAEIEPGGSGGGFLYMIFAPEIPAKAAALGNIKLEEKREWISGGKKRTMTAVAPAGSEFMQLWIYSPNGNTDCDLILNNITLTEMDGPAVSAVPVSAPAAGSIPGVLTFSDQDGDGIPEGWDAYPPGNGNNSFISTGEQGVRLQDANPDGGVGLIKWMPVTAGKEVEAVVKPEGSGGGFLYLTFAPRIPAKAGDLGAIKLREKREWISAGSEKRVKAKAPAGSKFLQLWLYSPKDNVNCDLQFSEIALNVSGEAAAAGTVIARPPEPPAGAENYPHYNPLSILPEGQLSVIDFETGDFSQIRTKEGGQKLVVSAPEPVRNGTYAMKVRMDHKNKRSEITGYRSAAYGEYKYGWSVYIPAEFDGTTSFSIVTQWHDWGTGKEYIEDGGPPTHLYIANNNWRLKIRYQDGEGGDKLTKKEFALGSVDPYRGKWTDFVVEVNWQSPKSGGGYFRMFRDGEQIVDYEGPTWYEGKVQGPFFKMGIYKGGGSWKGEEDKTYMYFDEFRMGDASVTKDQVDPAKQP